MCRCGAALIAAVCTGVHVFQQVLRSSYNVSDKAQRCSGLLTPLPAPRAFCDVLYQMNDFANREVNVFSVLLL